MIQQANPGAGYRAHQREIDEAVSRALTSGWYVLGAEGRAFEAEFAAWLKADRAIGCGNGTDALALTLRGLGIGAGKVVATVSHTAVATVAAIEMAGAAPLLIDIDPVHYTMDPGELADVAARVDAVIVVHLYGQPADLGAIAAICAARNIPLIEDCSQAHGAVWRGRTVGTVGMASCFSLYPTKNLGALGDGGIVATDDVVLADRIAALRQYGWRTHYVSDEVGINSRLDELQAAILRVKLRHLDAGNARRRKIAAAYDAAVGARAPARWPDATHVFHQYVVRSADRAGEQARLRARGVATGVHYPVPVHLQPAYLGRVALGPGRCARTETAAREVMSLPMYPELTDAQVAEVCAAVR